MLCAIGTSQHPRATYKPPIAKPAVPPTEKALNQASHTATAGPGSSAIVLGGIASELVKGKARTYVKQGRTWILETGG